MNIKEKENIERIIKANHENDMEEEKKKSAETEIQNAGLHRIYGQTRAEA